MSQKKKVRYRKSRARVLYPYRLIDYYKRKELWFPAFTNSVTYFEHFGYWAIRNHCNQNGIEFTQKAMDALKNLRAGNIALILRILDLIDNETYSDMKKIIEERNKLVHPGRKGITYREQKQKDRAESLLNQAKQSIKKIRSTIIREERGNEP